MAVTGCSTTSSSSGMTSYETKMLTECERYLGVGGTVTRAFCDCFKRSMNSQIDNSLTTSSEKAALRQNVDDVYNRCVASTASYADFASQNRPA